MPPEPLDPMVALNAIRTFAKTAVESEGGTATRYELILREILNVCDQAIPKKPGAKRQERPAGEGE